jgi:osmotically-inducible protein OsmY
MPSSSDGHANSVLRGIIDAMPTLGATPWTGWSLIVGCAALALSTPPTRSPDGRLRQRVFERIDDALERRHLNVDVRISGGVATVAGQIADVSEARRLLTTVADTPGVMDVIDDLTLDDDVIRRAVIEALNADPLIKEVPVSVRCAMGEVTLSSNQTSAEQRSRMVRIATSVQGVVHVVDEMR